jgi:hypothetical protein
MKRLCMNKELRRIWNEAVVVWFEVLLWNSSGGAEENHKNLGTVQHLSSKALNSYLRNVRLKSRLVLTKVFFHSLQTNIKIVSRKGSDRFLPKPTQFVIYLSRTHSTSYRVTTIYFSKRWLASRSRFEPDISRIYVISIVAWIHLLVLT